MSLVLNSDLIEHVEITPDTVIALTTGQKFMVLETADEVIARVIQFRRSLFEGLPVCQRHVGGRHIESRGPDVPEDEAPMN